MKRLLPPCLLFASLLLSSCDAVVTNGRVADSTPEILQKQLAGTWHREGKTFQVEFDEAGVGHLANLEWRNDKFEMSQAELVATEVDGQYYLSLQSLEEDDRFPGPLFSAFNVTEPNQVEVLIPKMKAIEALIESGKVAGAVDKGRYATIITIEDAKALIAAARPVEEYFETKDAMTLERLGEE